MPRNQDEGLGGLRDVARALNADEEWEWKMNEARADLRRSTNELLSHAEKLRESVDELAPVTRIHQEPTAEVALTEDELSYLVEAVDERGFREERDRPESSTAFDKLRQALAVESGPGGRFAA